MCLADHKVFTHCVLLANDNESPCMSPWIASICGVDVCGKIGFSSSTGIFLTWKSISIITVGAIGMEIRNAFDKFMVSLFHYQIYQNRCIISLKASGID